jgi:hypothetical protein
MNDVEILKHINKELNLELKKVDSSNWIQMGIL